MRKSVALLLVFVLAASCPMAIKPTFSAGDVAQNTWTQKAPMQQARSSLGVATVNGKIYAVGGFVANGVATGANEEYNPTTDTWETKTSMSTPRVHFATAVYQNKIYCIGGTGNGKNEVYDPETDTWENKTSMPTPRSRISANVVNGKIYVIGGFVSDASGSGSGSRLDVNEVYDPQTDTWTTKAPMPTAGFSYISGVVDNKIYITDSNRKMQIYDVETDTWSLGSPPPGYIGSGAAAATTGLNAPKRIYVVTELYGESRFNQVYDPQNDQWTTGTFMPTHRSNFNVAVADDLLYVIGGYAVKDQTFSEYLETGEMYPLIFYATIEQYVPLDYGTVPPVIDIASPENVNYTSSEIELNFTVNKPVEWMRYSLDGQDNVTVTGNVTLTVLSSGLHNFIVYATDEFGNTGVSKITYFSVEVPFPTALVAVASIATVAVVGVGLLVYFKKRKHSKKADKTE